MKDPIHRQVADLFTRRWDYHYVVSKLRRDPLYEAIYHELKDSEAPLLDLGSGLGLLAFFLRAKGIEVPVLGLDYDPRKVIGANRAAAASGHRNLTFRHHDARTGVPEHMGNVSILDILQFFTPEQQEKLLLDASLRIPSGGKLVIRSGLRDSSLRFKITVIGDLFAKASFWMKAGPTHYPAAADFHKILSPHGSVRITPLWGATPFNNHLIVLDKK